MTEQELNSQLKANLLRNIPSELHKKTSLPEWLELLHDEFVNNTEVNSLLFLQKASSVKNYDKLKSLFFVFLMKENKAVVQSLYGKYDDKVNKQVEDVLNLAIEVHSNGGDLKALQKVAYSAVNSAYSAFNAAAYAANAAAYAAKAAADATAYSAVNSAADAATYTKHAEKLMSLLNEC